MTDGREVIISEEAAEAAGNVLKETIARMAKFNKFLGQSEEQKEAMDTYIDSKIEDGVKSLTSEKLIDICRDETLPEVARDAVSTYLEGNLGESVSCELDSLMCEKTRDTISEYDIVRYTDSQFSEQVSESASEAINYSLGDMLPDHISEYTDTMKDEIKEELTDDLGGTLDGTVKKVIKDVFMGYFNPDPTDARRLEIQKDRADKYMKLLTTLGVEDSEHNFERINLYAKDNKEKI